MVGIPDRSGEAVAIGGTQNLKIEDPRTAARNPL